MRCPWTSCELNVIVVTYINAALKRVMTANHLSRCLIRKISETKIQYDAAGGLAPNMVTVCYETLRQLSELR